MNAIRKQFPRKILANPHAFPVSAESPQPLPQGKKPFFYSPVLVMDPLQAVLAIDRGLEFLASLHRVRHQRMQERKRHLQHLRDRLVTPRPGAPALNERDFAVIARPDLGI